MILCITSMQAQLKPAATAASTAAAMPAKTGRQYSKLSLKAGANLSVIYLARNVKENNNEPGYSLGGVYAFNGFIRLSALYTAFKTLNIEPTWENVKAHTYEANLELLARFPNKKTLIYPFAGLSYNTYKGYFTGQNDWLNLKEFYPVNSTVSNKWLGLNLGLGLEHNFGPVGLYIDYRMRVGRQDKAINVMDVCYSGGVKINLPTMKARGGRKSAGSVKETEELDKDGGLKKTEEPKKEAEPKKSGGHKKPGLFKRIFHPNDRFHWF